MSELITQVRPLELIEAEINFYKAQTANGIIEIGKRLIEAKEQVKHGEWGKWLEEKVDFTDRTAQNFMRIANEFGNTKTFSDLPISKLYALLDVPAEQREEFAQQNNLQELTTCEVEKAIKEYKSKLEQKTDEAEFFKTQVRCTENRLNDEKDRLEIQLREQETFSKVQIERADKIKRDANQAELTIKELQKHIAKLNQQDGDTAEVSRLRAAVIEQVDKLEKLGEENEKLQKQLHDKPIEVATRTVEKVVVPDEVAVAIYNKISSLYEGLAQLTAAEIQIFSEQVDTHFQDSIHKDIKDAISVLDRINAAVGDVR